MINDNDEVPISINKQRHFFASVEDHAEVMLGIAANVDSVPDRILESYAWRYDWRKLG